MPNDTPAATQLKAYQNREIEHLLTLTSLKGKTIVEIGSDTPLAVAQFCISQGAEKVFAVNPFLKNKKQNDANIIVINDVFENVSILPNSIDIIFGIACLEHIHNFDSLIDKIKELLTPSGFYYLHGDPFWTSPRGHHVWIQNPNGTMRYHFNLNNPVASWSHLVFDKKQMYEDLKKKMDPNDAFLCINEIYDSKSINRISPQNCIQKFQTSNLHYECTRTITEQEGNFFFNIARNTFYEEDLRTVGMSIYGTPA